MINISFSASTVTELCLELTSFLHSLEQGSTGRFPVKMVGAVGIEPALPTKTTGRLPAEPKPLLNVKTRPGRPPMSEQEKMEAKAVRTQKLLSEVTPVASPVLQEPKSVSKEHLSTEIKKLNDTKGMNKVLEIYGLFGVKRLGELDEKRYHEMLAVVEAAL